MTGLGYSTLFIVFCQILVHIQGIEIKDCGSKGAKITEASIEGCSSFPCIGTKGKPMKGVMKIKSSSATESLTCKAVGVIGGADVPFTGCPKNACDNLTKGDCPVEDGDEITYELSVPVPDSAPTVEINAKMILESDAGTNFICLEIPMKIEE